VRCADRDAVDPRPVPPAFFAGAFFVVFFEEDVAFFEEEVAFFEEEVAFFDEEAFFEEDAAFFDDDAFFDVGRAEARPTLYTSTSVSSASRTVTFPFALVRGDVVFDDGATLKSDSSTSSSSSATTMSRFFRRETATTAAAAAASAVPAATAVARWRETPYVSFSGTAIVCSSAVPV
jgi:hypothetical protein